MDHTILRVDDIHVRYRGLPILRGVSLDVKQGETVSVVGANGAGKSTLLRAVMASQRAYRGKILLEGKEIQALRTEEIVRLGVVYVPEEKMLFKPLNVEENLLLGAYSIKDRKVVQRNLQFVYKLFTRLEERKHQATATLSGGEQQMVAIGRGLMSNPRVLMLDEPSLGLAPILVDEVLGTVRRLKEEGITILLVEQNVREALDIADRGYVIQSGAILESGSGKDLLHSDRIRQAYLGF